MKKISFLLIAMIISGLSFGQLTGTKTIPGDYATIEAAITALNTSGVGAGGVTFNVAAGHTETFSDPTVGTITTNTGSATNPIIFQRSGAGANPLITGAALASSSTTDGIIKIEGTDYVTFDGIDVQENPGSTSNFYDWGYALLVASSTDGAQHTTIRNCAITLDNSNTSSRGIYSNNHSATSTSSITPTSADGTVSYSSIDNNTISNVYYGIYFSGYSSATYYSQDNYIGTGGGNSLTNFGGGSSAVYGIYMIYQNGARIANNMINGGTGSSSTVYVIYSGTGTNSNIDIYSNTITLDRSGNSTTYIIYNTTGASGTTNTVNIYNNIVENCTFTTATSASWYGLYCSASAATVNIYGNIIRNNTKPGTGITYLLYQFNTAASGNENVYNNSIYGNANTGTGTLYCLYSSPVSTTNKEIFRNSVYDNSTGGSSLYGLYTSTGATVNIYQNSIYGQSTTSSSGNNYGIYISSGTTLSCYNNFISDLQAPASSNNPAIRGIYVSSGTTIGLYYNTIYLDATSTGTNFGSCAVYASTSPALEMRNNILADLSTPNGTGLSVAFRRSSTTIGSYATTSNNNDFYAGTPGPSNLIFYDGTNAFQTILDYQTFVSPIDAASFTSLPPFMNVAFTPYDLHIQTGVSTKCESGGSTVSTPNITIDYDGQARYPNPGYPDDPSYPASAPDVGADEFAGIPSFSCATPVPGNTMSTANNLCLGQEITLSLENAVPGTGVSYQWQSSPDGVTYSDITGETSLVYTTTPAESLYYQCIVTCQNGPESATSTPIQVDFLNSILTTTPGNRCGTGTVDLYATGSTGTTLNWYDALTGGAWAGTGSPFTTPVISSTTNYYVGAEGISAGNAAVGAGATTSSTYSNPFYSLWSNLHTQHLITAAELTAAGISAGDLTSVALDVTNAGTLPMIDLSVKIGATTETSLTAFLSPLFTEVYTNASYMPTLGLNVLLFSTPFNWDGTSSIVLEFCHGNGSSTATMSRTVKADATAYASSIRAYRTSATSGATICADVTTNLLTYTTRPQFTFGGQVACSSPRSMVVATVTAPPALTITPDQTVCNNSVGMLEVTSTLADYDTYVWTPVTNLYTDAACTVPYVAGTSATTVYAKTSTPGSTIYTCLGTNATTLCANTATSEVTTLPGTVVIESTPVSICITGTPTLDATPATGYGTATLQWQDSPDGIAFTDIPGANSASYTPAAPVTTTTYYKIQVYVGAVLCTESNVVTLIVNDPQLTGTTPGSRCGIGTVTLGATGTGGTLTWYDMPAGGTVVGTGPSFTTPVISNTTTYYVQNESAGTVNEIGGRTDVVTTSGFLTTPNWGVRFDATVGFTLNSTTIYPVGSGTVTIALLDDANTEIASTAAMPVSGTGAATPNVVTLGFNVPIGTDYKLVLKDYSGITSLLRESSGNSFPYPSPSGAISVTSGWTGSSSSSYYWFYSLDISIGCSSPRIGVTATVTPAPDLTISVGQTVCNNSPAMITVTSTIADFDTYVWTPATNMFTDAACTIPYVAGASATTVYAKSTTGSVTDYTCTAENLTSMCVNVATSEVTILPASPPITADPAAICVTGSTTLTPNPSTGYGTATFQWQDSPDGITYTDIPGATAISYTTPTLTSTTYYKLIISLLGVPCTESLGIAQVDDPQVTNTVPGSRCGTGTVTLIGFTGAGYQLDWYDAPTGGNFLGTGFFFTTPVISATTDFYVSASSGGSSTYFVGPSDPASVGTTSSSTLTNHFMIFDITAGGLILNSVDIFPTATLGSSYTIIIQDAALNEIYNSGPFVNTVTGGATAQTVTIDATIPQGTGYRMGVSVNAGMTRNTAGAAYPYSVPGVVSITGNTFSTAYYYYFYNWELSTGCASARTAVTATVNPAPPVMATAAPTTICEGESSTLSASSSNDPNYTYTWTPTTTPPTGASVMAYPPVTTTYTVQANDNTAGPYAGCQAFADVLVTVNPMPGAITITPPGAGINPGDIQELTASGGLVQPVSILSENFNSGAPGWTFENGATSPPAGDWYYQPVPYSGGCCSFTNFTTTDGGSFAYADSDAGGSGTTNDTKLISPSFSTMGYSAATLTFENLYYQIGSDITVALEISTDGGTTWTILRDYLALGSQGTTTSGAQATTLATVDLAAYLNQADVRIRYNYSSGWGYYWLIDDVQVTGTPVAAFTWAPFTDLYSDPAATVPYTGTVNPTVYSKPSMARTYIVTASSPSLCTTSNSVTVSLLPVPTITGAGTVCSGTRGEIYTTETGMTNYTWTVSADGTIVSGGGTSDNTVTIDWMIAGTQTITVNYTDSYGYQAAVPTAMNVTVNPVPDAVAGADRTICAGQNTILGAAAVAGNTYSWTSVPAGFTSSTADPSVSPLVTTTYTLIETITATGCMNSHSVIVTVNPIPAAVAGADRAICLGENTRIGATAVAGNTYSWTSVPAGYTSALANPLVHPLVTTTYTLVETITATGCTNTHSVIVTVNPLPDANAGANRGICLGESTQIGAAPVPGSTYSWSSLPPGFSSTEANPTVTPLTTSIYTLVEIITATGCLNSNGVFVTVNPLPAAAGSITGSGTVTQGQTGVAYSVPAIANATGYTWTLPTGATITSGDNTSSIVVDFSASASSGVMSVYGSNACGDGTQSPDFTITVTSSVPTTLTVGNEIVHVGETKCYNALETITVAGSGTTFVVEPGGDATFIAGQKILFLPGTTVQSGGHMWAYITTTGVYCGILAPSIVSVATEEFTPPYSDKSFFKVYPNPTSGKFTMELTGVDEESEVFVEIYTMRGESMHKVKLIGETSHEFTLEGNPPGIYILRILNKDMAGTAKIIKR